MQSLNGETQLAKLYIPGKSDPEEFLRWRWYLIKREKVKYRHFKAHIFLEATLKGWRWGDLGVPAGVCGAKLC